MSERRLVGVIYEDPDWPGMWCSTLMECDICNTEWVAVYPSYLTHMNCINDECGHTVEVPPNEIEPDSEKEEIERMEGEGEDGGEFPF